MNRFEHALNKKKGNIRVRAIPVRPALQRRSTQQRNTAHSPTTTTSYFFSAHRVEVKLRRLLLLPVTAVTRRFRDNPHRSAQEYAEAMMMLLVGNLLVSQYPQVLTIIRWMYQRMQDPESERRSAGWMPLSSPLFSLQ